VPRVAILASYNGSGFVALYEAMQSGKLSIEIPLVISNNSSAKVLETATAYGIKNFAINTKTAQNPDAKIEELLRKYGCDFVFLSGYMKKVAPNITKSFQVINCHPALLPNYGGAGMYGRFVHEAVIKNSEKISGVTLHEVDENYDEGKIILQKKLSLAKDETAHSLEAKIKELEKIAIVEAFQAIIS